MRPRMRIGGEDARLRNCSSSRGRLDLLAPMLGRDCPHESVGYELTYQSQVRNTFEEEVEKISHSPARGICIDNIFYLTIISY